MTSSREIITFQFGNYSNYIGAHWWNLQEASFNYEPSIEQSEIDHDVLFREGTDLRGQTTFTPRLLLVDLDGSLKHLPENGELYEDLSDIFSPSASKTQDSKLEKVKSNIMWDDNEIEVIQKESTSKSAFIADIDNPKVDINDKEYNLSENVETWTDFLYARYHPRTFNIIKNYKVSPNKETFDTFTNGSLMWKNEQFDYEFTDKIRQYIEECDNCQGFQTIFDCTNAFSGLSIKCLEHLNDEYSKSNFAIPVFPPKSILFENADQAMTDSIRVVNIALTYSNLIEQSSLFLPLSLNTNAWRQLGTGRKFPNINYNSTNFYQTSGILASYLETITLRYRFKNSTASTTHLSGFCNDLTNYGRKLTAAGLSFPFPMRSDHDLIDCLDKFDNNFFTQLSPNTKIGNDYVVQSICVRGIPKNRLKKPLQQAKDQMKMSAYKCNSISEMFQLYFQCSMHSSMSHVSSISNSIALKKPYPMEIFDERLNTNGFLTDTIRNDDEKIIGIPTVASIQSSSDLANTLETLHREASRIKLNKLHRFQETGMESDDFIEILESLNQFKDKYDDNIEL